MSGRGWEKLTASDIARLQTRGAPAPPKPSKYRNVKVHIDGETFDSKAEAQTWQELKMRVRSGEISDLQRQVRFQLYAPDFTEVPASGRYVTISEYVADYQWNEAGRTVVADRKGARNTQVFALKRKWLELQSGIEIREIR